MTRCTYSIFWVRNLWGMLVVIKCRRFPGPACGSIKVSHKGNRNIQNYEDRNFRNRCTPVHATSMGGVAPISLQLQKAWSVKRLIPFIKVSFRAAIAYIVHSFSSRSIWIIITSRRTWNFCGSHRIFYPVSASWNSIEKTMTQQIKLNSMMRITWNLKF